MPTVSADNKKLIRGSTVGQRSVYGCGGSEGGGHTRYDFDLNAGSPQNLQFLSGTTENQRITTLQTHDYLAGGTEPNQ